MTEGRRWFSNLACRFSLAGLLAVPWWCATAETTQIVLDRDGSTIVLEPYAPNIVRVSLSLLRNQAIAAPGYGFVATPAAAGWTHLENDQADVYRSSRLVVTVAVPHPGKPMATEVDIAKFFKGSAPPAHITLSTPEGETLHPAGMFDHDRTARLHIPEPDRAVKAPRADLAAIGPEAHRLDEVGMAVEC